MRHDLSQLLAPIAPMKRANFNDSRRGSILSVALICGAAVAAIICISIYFLSRTSRLEHELAAKSQRLDKALQEAEIARKASDAAHLREVQNVRLTTARNLRSEVLANLRDQEARLEKAKKNSVEIRADVAALLTSDAGRKLATRPASLRAAMYLVDYRLRELPSTEIATTKQEEARRYVVKLQSAEDAYEPDENFRAQLSALSAYTSNLEAAVSSVRVSVDSLMAESKIIVSDESRPLTENLGDAISRAKREESARLEHENAQLVAKAREVAAHTKARMAASEITSSSAAAEVVQKAKLEKERVLAEQDALQIKNDAKVAVIGSEDERRQQLTAAERARKLQEAQNPAFRAKLAPFFASGFWQPGDTRPSGIAATPVSLERLRSYGALAPTAYGVARLGEAATNRNNDRPKWEKDFGTQIGRAKPQVRAELVERQKLLIEYGDYFVELGYLMK